MEDKYKRIQEELISLPSEMGVIPSGSTFTFTEEGMRKSLAESKDFSLTKMESIPLDGADDTIKYKFEAELEYKGRVFPIQLYVLPVQVLNLTDMPRGNQIDESEVKESQKQTLYMETSMYLGEKPLEGFHLQLKVLHTVVPQASLVLDFMPYRMLSGKWLSMAADSQIPPSPDYLYTIHAIYEGEEDSRRYWLHTHGLNRCASVEIEILDIQNGAQQMYDLIGIVAKMFIEKEIPKENEEFLVGYDGLGINLCWERWEEVAPNLGEGKLGGLSDRQEGDIHANPSGILSAVENGIKTSPELYAKTLSENPIYYISNEETDRMSDLAKEHFHYFKETFTKQNQPKKKSLFGIFSKKEDNQDWTFLVKLGLATDPEEGQDSMATPKEHLWFKVIEINEAGITGELVNDPYWIAKLKKGDKNTYPLEVLTDWVIYSPDNNYTPDSIYQIV